MVTFDKLKIAICYDRVNKFGGAERTLLTLHEMFPNAPLYTSVLDLDNAPWAKVFPKIYTSFLQKISFARNNHELFGWLMPLAFETFNFNEFDLVISVTSEAAKGIITNTNTLHVCYLLTPTRYLWSGKEFYFNNPPQKFKIFPFFKWISKPIISYLKKWDKVASARPDEIISISSAVSERIKKYYERESETIFPPVEVKKLNKGNNDYYFIAGRFEPYKRLDLVVSTFNEIGLPLIVAGSGSEFFRQRKKANKNIKFIYKPTDEKLWKLYANAKVFLMPQEEDFGIMAVEAQGFGVPVIAYNKGGSLDTVVSNKTGVFFDTQNNQSLKHAIAKFDTMRFNYKYLTDNAKNFSKERFKRQLQRSLVRSYNSWRGRNQTLA